MKKTGLALFLILALPLSLALSVDIQSNYLPGQTIIIKLDGNFLDNIQKSDVSFMSGRDFLPLTFDLAKIKDDYYLYAILQDFPRNYTLTIKNVHYTESGIEKTSNLVYNFSTSNNTALFSVEPGFIIATSNFSVKIKSRIQDINVQSSFLNSSQNIFIKEGKSASLFFSAGNSENLNFLALFSGDLSYNLPVYIIKKQRIINASLPLTSLKFNKPVFNLSIIKKQNFQFEIELLNNGQTDLHNITISSDSELVKISPEKINSLLSEDSVLLNLSVKAGESGVFSANLKASADDYEASSLIYLNSLENLASYTNFTKNMSDIPVSKTCGEEQGIFCQADEICSSNVKLTSEAKLCCLGKCNKASSGGKWIFLIILLIILAAGGYFFYRKAKLKKFTAGDFLKDKQKEYAERFNPKSEEVSNKLSKN